MRSTAPALIAVLDQAQSFLVVDLYTITLRSGAALLWTSNTDPVTIGGSTWAVTGPRLSRSRISSKLDIEVATLDLKLSADAADLLDGIPVAAFVNNGGFDGAAVRLDRAYLATPTATPMVVTGYFQGRVSTAQADRDGADITVKASTVLLDLPMPRNVYQAQCVNTLYDTSCAVIRANFTWSNTVAVGSTVITIVPATALGSMAPVAGNTPLATRFALGSITFTSGPNAGSVRGIKAAADGSISLVYPLDQAPVAGETFTLSYGCDHTMATCKLFNNFANFRGFPYIPVAEPSA